MNTPRILLMTLLLCTVSTTKLSTTMAATTTVTAINDGKVTAWLRQANGLIANNDYVGAQKVLKKVLAADPNNSEGRRLMDKCEAYAREQKAKERTAFENACKKEGVSALRQFINMYPYSEYRQEAENRIQDYTLWEQAKRINTKDAYLNYQRTSKLKAYWADSERILREISSIEDWATIENGISFNKQTAKSDGTYRRSYNEAEAIREVETFIKKYPESSKISDANYTLYLLKAEQSYRSKGVTSALEYYDKAKKIKSLPSWADNHRAEMQRERDFNLMKSSSDEDALKSFLNSLPYSDLEHRNIISNRLAIVKSDKLTTSSSDYDFNAALRYATNSYTRSTVQARIDRIKTQKKRDRRWYLHRQHVRWWNRNSLFGIGIGYDMLGNTLSWKAGLRYRLGTSEDVFNISIGADYVWHGNMVNKKSSHSSSYYYDDYYDTPDLSTSYIASYVEVPLTMKFNFADGFRENNFYLGITGTWGYRVDKSSKYDTNEQTIAIEPCLGYNWSKFDWGLYYKHYFSGYHIVSSDYEHYGDRDVDKDRIGMYMILYF